MSDLINLFINLCSIDSPTGEEKKIRDYILVFAKKYTNFVKKDNFGNIYIRFGKAPKIFLSAHLDTVEPGKGIKPRIKNGYIASDGKTILGADNKAAVASILQVLKELSKEKLPLSFEILFTLSEESGNYGAINFDYFLLHSKIGFCFDVSQPLGAIITASPFYERFDVTIIGKEAHASKPKEAINVLFPLKTILSKQKLGKIDQHTLFNLGILAGGYVRNTIPGEIILKGEIRSFFEKNLLLAKEKIFSLLAFIEKKYQVKIKKDFVRENPGYFHNNQNKLKKIKNIIKKSGLKPIFQKAWGVSDANIFNNKGLLCFNLADGTEFTHSKQERIRIDNLLKLKKIIKNLIHYW